MECALHHVFARESNQMYPDWDKPEVVSVLRKQAFSLYQSLGSDIQQKILRAHESGGTEAALKSLKILMDYFLAQYAFHSAIADRLAYQLKEEREQISAVLNRL